ncbi:helix-turn-helix domain-containing protein [Alkalihalophilus marmarensis]|uniref:helix-turn-helix transcriptional regulator n=1 Tax=Alkalihalophilus marmarensis TaxID=521377 RepID=UPI0020418292|nr:helix-turn-helix transcriptional regulator [Alkalihalophilus marmarensis]MCM3488756.1 helix-turn-helix domain-containing protein [Alkalihalophilus marmarensis]
MTKLKRILFERELKQKDIAAKVGIDTGTMSKIVKGDSIPTLPVALAIAEVLGMSVEELWGEYKKELK